MTETVLITGATGFTGSFLVERYVREGWEVHGTYRDPIEDEAWIPDAVTLHPIDLRDGSSTRELLRELRPSVVQHLAGQSSVAVSWEDPADTLVENSLCQLNVLEAVRISAPSARVVVVGSCDEYGDVTVADNPISEGAPLLPTSPYALSKVTQDLMGYQYAVAYSLQVIRARPFLQLGPRRSDRFVAGSFARQIAEIEAGRREPVVHVGNIELVRDFVDVRDVASALKSLGALGRTGEVYNLSSGLGHSLRDLLQNMMSAVGVVAEIRRESSRLRPGEPSTLVGNSDRLWQLAGWRPTISFSESARDTVQYWRDRIR